MADTKISALTAVGTPAVTDQFGVNQGGVSKEETLAQIRGCLPVLPTVRAVSAEATGTGNVTPTLPSGHATNDILLLVVQSANEAVTAPAGYTQVGPRNGIGAAATAGSTKLSAFWKRDGGSESDPTVTDAGNRTYATMLAITGCPTAGDPFHLMNAATKVAGTSTTGTAPAGVTGIDNCLILALFAHAISNAGAQASAETNADLTSITEQFDDSSTDGVGGGLCVVSGVKAKAGPFAATTLTWANTTLDATMTLAMLPQDFTDATKPAPGSHNIEIQTFYGTPADLDDTWVKPSGARKVLVQILDGGGSGSGGNTATTAAGGGGGGGGGYDEAWFTADDLAATITVHAGKGGAVGTALNQAGNIGVVSEFDKGSATSPLSSTKRVAGIVPTAAASAAGGAGGSGSGRGATSKAAGARITLDAATAGVALGGIGGRGGGPGGTGIVAGSPAEWGGGGGESGSDTDATTTGPNNGFSLRGAGGGGGGRTTTNIGVGGGGGGAAAAASTQGTPGTNSSRLPYGGAGGCGGGSSTVTGGSGGFPGGGGGGGAGVAGGFGGAGGHGCVVVTTFFS